MANKRYFTNGTMANLLVNTLLLLTLVINVQSVMLPTRLQAKTPPEPLLNGTIHLHDDPPAYSLTIIEGASIETTVHSEEAITVNLNQAVPDQDVNVEVTIYSGPNIIHFEADKNKSTKLVVTYRANSFGDRLVKFKTNEVAGHAEIVCKISNQPKNFTIDDSTAYISIDVNRNWNLKIIIQIFGWIYFFAWSASFYFQVILNYQRKSVVGLNFDFLFFNLLGFTCYSIYNMTLMFSHEVQKEYYQRYTYSRIPVEYNDVFFSVHAFVITLVTVCQCAIYERGEQRISLPAGIFIAISISLGLGLYITNLFNGVTILNVVLYLSYVKLVITIIKYVPQAFMNYQRKATTGWSIHNILLDFTGGTFSIMQMFMIAYNYDDWISIFGNFTKFGLGAISMSFDILFVIQHYYLYKQPFDNLEGSSDSIPSPVISQSIRSTSYVPPAPPVVVSDDGHSNDATNDSDVEPHNNN